MKKFTAVLATLAILSGCAAPRKVVFEPLPMKYGDTTRMSVPFAKDPTVIHLADRYLMYYSVPPFEKSRLSEAQGETDWGGAIAESRNLVDWTRIGRIDIRDSEGNPVYGAVAPCVKKFDDGKIHIFYQKRWAPAANNSNIWHAISTDGITFNNVSDCPVFIPDTDWSLNRSIDAEVYRVKDKLILMFATREKTGRIQILGMAEAPYGTDYGPGKWTLISTDGPFLQPDYPWEGKCIEAPTVIKHKGIWYLFYAGAYNHERQQIGLCTSTDGIHFTRVSYDPQNPGLVFRAGEKGSWNAGESGHPGVFRDDDGQVYLFFQGKASRNANYFLSVCKVSFE